MESYFMAYFKTMYKIHLARGKKLQIMITAKIKSQQKNAF